MWPIFWAAVFAIGLAGEAIGLWRSEAGDTLSEQVWFVFGRFPFLRFLCTSLLLWVTIHFATLGAYAGWRSFGGWVLITAGAYLLWSRVFN